MATQAMRRCYLLASATLLVACGDGPTRPSVGSETNWLACERTDDCPADTECQCGVCTRDCLGLNDCAAVSGAAACLQASSVSERNCRVGFVEPSGGICLPGCTHDRDCSSALRCVSGVCVPGVAMTPAGVVSGLPGDGGVAFIPVDVSDAGHRDGAAPDSGGAAGDDAAAGGDGGSSDGSVGASGDAGSQDGQLGGGVDEQGNVYRDPKPTCPCTSDVPEDQPAPRPGEVQENAYGHPLPGVAPSEGTPFMLNQCVGASMAFPTYTFTLDSGCTQYSNCHVPCAQDADCPNGGSGAALPRCSNTQLCFLDCREGRGCPDGMVCITGVDGAACYWPRDVLDPGCSGYCQQQPVPRDCDDWCADRFVACDPAQGALCCEGLSCTEGGYCDVP